MQRRGNAVSVTIDVLQTIQNRVGECEGEIEALQMEIKAVNQVKSNLEQEVLVLTDENAHLRREINKTSNAIGPSEISRHRY